MAVNAEIKFPAIWITSSLQTGKPIHLCPRTQEELIGPFERWPRYSLWIPSVLLDCSGQEFVCRDVTNIPKMPFWIKPVEPFWGVKWYLGNWKADLVVDGPMQLTLDEFKSKICQLANTTLVQGITRKKLKELVMASKTYNEAIYVLDGNYAFELSNPSWHPSQDSAIAKYEAEFESCEVRSPIRKKSE